MLQKAPHITEHEDNGDMADEADNTLCDAESTMSESESSTENEDDDQDEGQEMQGDEVVLDNNNKDSFFPASKFQSGSQTSGYYTADQYGATTTTTNSSAEQSQDKMQSLRTIHRKIVSLDNRSLRNSSSSVDHLAKVEHFSEDDDSESEQISPQKPIRIRSQSHLQTSKTHATTGMQSHALQTQGASGDHDYATTKSPPQAETETGRMDVQKEVLDFGDEEEWEDMSVNDENSGPEDLVNDILQKKPSQHNRAYSKSKGCNTFSKPFLITLVQHLHYGTNQ